MQHLNRRRPFAGLHSPHSCCHCSHASSCQTMLCTGQAGFGHSVCGDFCCNNLQQRAANIDAFQYYAAMQLAMNRRA